jgi:predicted Rossmann-fold nucleotide-binding protein
LVIAVFGSGSKLDRCAWAAGKAVASLGHDLLTGGGGGCMQSALDGFLEISSRKGKSHAILPESKYQPSGYDQVIRTRFDAPKDLGASPFSRNLVNVAFCHGCVFVSDTPGTLTEVIWMHRVGKPSAFLGSQTEWESARSQLKEASAAHDIIVSIATGDEDLERKAHDLVQKLVETLSDRL